LLCVGSLNLTAIVDAQDGKWGMFGWFWLPLLPMFVVFFVSALAETNRPPFDLVEAESELVAGFAVEIRRRVPLFFLGEYTPSRPCAPWRHLLRLAPPFQVALHLGTGVIWFTLKCRSVLPVRAARRSFALPLRPVDVGWKLFLQTRWRWS
jgi:NADH-quinone oxidoreductase subunit H